VIASDRCPPAILRHVLMTSVVLVSAACTQPAAPDATACVAPACVDLPLARFRADELASVGANGWDDAATVVVRDRDAWQATWNKMHERLAGPRPPMPAVDFSSEMIVVIALGARSTSGFGVTITGASESDGVITIDALSTGPGPGCVTAQVITYPIDLVRLPRRSSAVFFRVGAGVTSCR